MKPSVCLYSMQGAFCLCLQRSPLPCVYGRSPTNQRTNNMPRQQTLQIEQSPAFQDHGIQFGTQVVARPVDTYVDQGADNKMRQLAGLLDAGQALYKTIDETDQKEGAKDRALGMPKKATVLGSYEHGWLSLDGSIKGKEDAEKLAASFSTGFDRNAPGGVDGWLQARSQELTKGMQPGPFSEAYTKKLTEGFQAIRDKHFQEQKDSVTATAETNVVSLLAGAARAKTNKGEAVTVDDFLGVRQSLADSGLGLDTTRMDKLGHAALKALASEGNYQAIRAARKGNKDGLMAFPTLAEDDLSALEQHAATVYLNKQEAAHKAVKEEHHDKVSATMFPIIQAAQAGKTGDAQKAFDSVVASGVFAHEPEAIDKWQRMLVSTGDKSDSFEQVDLYNKVTLSILEDGWNMKQIQSAGLSPKLMRDAFGVYARKRSEDRQAASEGRTEARTAKALETASRITSGADFRPTLHATLEELPKLEGYAKEADFTGKKGQAVRAIRADTEKELVRTAMERGSDIDGWRQDVVRIRENAKRRTEAAMGSKDVQHLPPAFIRHDTWEEYKAAQGRGEYEANMAELEAARKWFKDKASRPTR